MNDLILVTAHCPTEEQEGMLEECIDSVVGLGYHILLISHTHVPMHIQKKCNYYFYDYFNDINYDDDLLFFVRYCIKDITIRSKYFTKEFYGFAIYRMFTIASRIAENFGYKNIHHIEYDCILKNKNIIDDHNGILETHDSVFYTEKGKEENMILGAFKSFKVNKLPKLFKEYDKDMMRRMMVEIPLLPLETFTKHIFTKSGNVLFRDSIELKKEDLIQRESPARLKFFTPYFNAGEDSFQLFYKNTKSIEDSVRVYINGEKIVHISIKPGYWVIRDLCRSTELKSLLILSNGKMIYDKTYSPEERESLKKNAYLIDEKDN